MNHYKRNYPWNQETNDVKEPQSTAIVAINYNTQHLITQLIWSIYHNLSSRKFAKLVIVDNHSSDGSQILLRHLAKEGLIDYIENETNIYHGPALNQAIDYLSLKQEKDKTHAINAIWVLDSDCVVLRPDTLTAATKIMNQTQAALVGQSVTDIWNKGTFGLHSLLLDPSQVWRDPIIPFEEHGGPSKHLQESCIQAGLILTPFNFTTERYIIHLGRGTLATIAKNNEVDNLYFEWAKDHSTPHYAGEITAEDAYNNFQKEFFKEVPNFEPETISLAIKR